MHSVVFVKGDHDRLYPESHAICSFVQVTTLRADVAQKNVYISELLDRLAIVECEVTGEKLASCAMEMPLALSVTLCMERLSILILFSIWAARLRAAGFAVISQYFILEPAWHTKVYFFFKFFFFFAVKFGRM